MARRQGFNKAENRLRVRIRLAIREALDDDLIGDGTLGYINDTHIGDMADAAVREIQRTRLHEEWLARHGWQP